MVSLVCQAFGVSIALLWLGCSSVWAKDLSQQYIAAEMDDAIPMDVNERSAGCSIAINSRGLPDPQPLLIIPGTDRFMDPQTRNGIIRFEHGETVEIFCSDSFIAPFTNHTTLLATCDLNNEFHVNGKSFNFTALQCKHHVYHTARRGASPDLCPIGITHIEVGFHVDTRFMKVLDICQDEILESTLFVYYHQKPANAGFQRALNRPPFITGKFFHGRNVNNRYTGFVQRRTIGELIGEDRVAELWDDSQNFFLARGHLAARSDLIFGSQQRATFYFMNAAPQWHSFNSGNWESIEFDLKVFIANRNMDTEMYTGTHGIQELADAQGVAHKLFLSFDEYGNGRIPVPTFFYKIVIGMRSRRGIVFIGLNNPHATREEVESGKYTLCTDISDQVNFIRWDRTNLSKGYSYACDVNEFAAVVGHLPAAVNTTGLLL